MRCTPCTLLQAPGFLDILLYVAMQSTNDMQDNTASTISGQSADLRDESVAAVTTAGDPSPYPVPLVVGITGHRDLVASEIPLLRRKIREFFTGLQTRFPALPINVSLPDAPLMVSALPEPFTVLAPPERFIVSKLEY